MYGIKRGRRLIVNMSRNRSSWARLIFSLFVLLALYISVLISVRNYTKIFIAFLTLFWHALANFYCASISSFRFSESDKHYIEIKNKFVRKIFMRPISIGGIETTSKTDNRTNIIGFILNIINIVLFVSFEVLLLLPEISCEPYTFLMVIGTRTRGYEHLEFILHSFNEIIPAEGARAYAFILVPIFLAFMIIFDRKIKKHRESLERRTKKTPPLYKQSPYKQSLKKLIKRSEWHSRLWVSLEDIAARKNKKKLEFWFDKDQLKQIEKLVKAASKDTELRLETKENKLVSFTVIDTFDNKVIFTGEFL